MDDNCNYSEILAQISKTLTANPAMLSKIDLDKLLVDLCGMDDDDGDMWVRRSHDEEILPVEKGCLGESVVGQLKSLHLLLRELLETPKYMDNDFKQTVVTALFDVSFVLRSECSTSSSCSGVNDQTQVFDQYSDFNLIAKAIKILTSGKDKILPRVKSAYLYVLHEGVQNIQFSPPTIKCYLEVFSQYLDSLIHPSQLEGLVCAADAERVQNVSQLISNGGISSQALGDDNLMDILFLLTEYLTAEYCNSGFSEPQDDDGTSAFEEVDEVDSSSSEEGLQIAPRVLLRKITFQVGLLLLLQHRKLFKQSASKFPSDHSIGWLFKLISHLAKIWPEDEICQAFTQQLLVHSAVLSFKLQVHRQNEGLLTFPLLVFKNIFSIHLRELFCTTESYPHPYPRNLDHDLLKEYRSTFWKTIAKLIAEGCDRWLDFFEEHASTDPAIVIFFTFTTKIPWPKLCRDHIFCDAVGKTVARDVYERRRLFDSTPCGGDSILSDYEFFKRANEFIRHTSPLIRALSIDFFFPSREETFPQDTKLLEDRLLFEENLHLVAKLCRLNHFSSCATIVIEKCFNRFLPLRQQYWSALTSADEPADVDSLQVLDILTTCAATLLSPGHKLRASLDTRKTAVGMVQFIGFLIQSDNRLKFKQVDIDTSSVGYGKFHLGISQRVSYNLQVLVTQYSDQSFELSLNADYILDPLEIMTRRNKSDRMYYRIDFSILLQLLSFLSERTLSHLAEVGNLGTVCKFYSNIVQTRLRFLIADEEEVCDAEEVWRLIQSCLRIVDKVGFKAMEASGFSIQVLYEFLRVHPNEVLSFLSSSRPDWTGLVSAVGWWVKVNGALTNTQPFDQEVFPHFEAVHLLRKWHVGQRYCRIKLDSHQVSGVLFFLSWVSRKNILPAILPAFGVLLSPELDYIQSFEVVVSGRISACDIGLCFEILPFVHTVIDTAVHPFAKGVLQTLVQRLTFAHFLPEFDHQGMLDAVSRDFRFPSYSTNTSICCALSHFAFFCEAAPKFLKKKKVTPKDLDGFHRSLHRFWVNEFRLVDSLTAAEFDVAVDFLGAYFSMHRESSGAEGDDEDYRFSIEDCFEMGHEVLYLEMGMNDCARVIISIIRIILDELNNLVERESSSEIDRGLLCYSSKRDKIRNIVQIFWNFEDTPFFQHFYHQAVRDWKEECIGNRVLETLIELQRRAPDINYWFTCFAGDDDEEETTLAQALQKVAKGLSKDFTKENTLKWRKYFVEEKVAVCQGCKALCEPEMQFEADKKRFCGVCSKEGYHQVMYWCDFCEGGICEDCSPEEFEYDDEEEFKKFHPSDSAGGVRHPHVVSFEVKGEMEDEGERELPPQKRQRLE